MTMHDDPVTTAPDGPPRGLWSTGRAAQPTGTDRYVAAMATLAALFMIVAGVWALADPASFADLVDFPEHEHFLHDLGAFQVGIGLMLVLALIWRDPPAVALAGFVVSNTIHAVNHGIDLDLGGRDSDPWLLGALSLATGLALALRLRQLHYVVGRVGTATNAALAPLVDQKTVLVTTFRCDGTAVATPVSIAVDGDRAFVRSFEKAGKTKRLRGDPRLEVAASTARGRPLGSAITARARRLDGAEARWAGRLLARKHPVLHGIVVPLSHRIGRRKAGRTVHFELVPTEP
ncbi:MAG: PPOX class F420-dependent oxidoreductase [Acidimicrobiales bacterium]